MEGRRVSRRWRTIGVLAVGISIGTVMVATPAIGHVGGTINHVWSHLKPKADKRYVKLGDAPWAVVNTDGTLARGNRVVSSAKITTGQYQVLFKRNVTGCTYIATVGNPGDGFSSGIIGVAALSGVPKGVFVGTQDAAGAFSDRSFHLAVFCSGSSPATTSLRLGGGGGGPNT